MPISPVLSCIGAGRLGSTLCKLLAQQVTIGQILNSTAQSSLQAAEFIGTGDPVDSLDQLKAADIWLIATPDEAIATASKSLQATAILRPADLVFHCSGVLDSTILIGSSIACASLHPLHSFAQPQRSVDSFQGTPCAMEGDGAALTKLGALFSAIGARPFEINRDQKVLYHAAAVMSCNYLVTLLDIGDNILQAAGLEQPESTDSPLRPLIEKTLQNYYASSAQRALTGPIARGDHDTVAAHLNALQTSSVDQWVWPDVYRSLGLASVALARRGKLAGSAPLERIEKLLQTHKTLQKSP